MILREATYCHFHWVMLMWRTSALLEPWTPDERHIPPPVSNSKHNHKHNKFNRENFQINWKLPKLSVGEISHRTEKLLIFRVYPCVYFFPPRTRRELTVSPQKSIELTAPYPFPTLCSLNIISRQDHVKSGSVFRSQNRDCVALWGMEVERNT